MSSKAHRTKIRRRIQPQGALGNTQVFRIKSRTHAAGVEYLVTINKITGTTHCSCPSTRPCWHADTALAHIRRNGTRSTIATPAQPERPRYVGPIDTDEAYAS